MAALALVLVACGDDDDDDAGGAAATSAPTTEAAGAAPEEPEFGYEGELGPENWGELSDEWNLCAEGTAQSPIDLTAATEENIADIGFDYAESALNIYNNGHTIEVEYDDGSSIDLDGQTYDVDQFHFHAGSEHTVDGQQSAMELHIVHRTPQDELAVVGVLIETGAENAALAPVFEHIPTEVSEESEGPVEGEAVNLAEVLPDTQTYFQYVGSLTTPDCSEEVSWQVLDTPIEISQEQLDAFTAVVDGNFRPSQPLGDRDLVHDTGPDA